MKIVKEQLVDRQGIQVKILEFSDGSRLELLASLGSAEQQRIVERHGRPRTPIADVPMSEDWREKTAFPLGMREDGSFFEAEEVKALLEKTMALARQENDPAESGSDDLPRIAG